MNDLEWKNTIIMFRLIVSSYSLHYISNLEAKELFKNSMEKIFEELESMRAELKDRDSDGD